jgi:hypothetical protein
MLDNEPATVKSATMAHVRKAMALALVAMLLLTGCGRGVQRAREVATAGPSASAAPSAAVSATSAPPTTPTPTAPAGTFAIQVSDREGNKPPGIPVDMTSPRRKRYVTDASGVVSDSVPEGFYRFEIAKRCHDAVIVHSGATAQVGVAGLKETSGDMLIGWEHRFGPTTPVSFDPSNRWKRGQKIVVTFRVTDRCSNKAAASKSLETFVVNRSQNLTLSGTPALRSDAKGDARFTVICNASGPVELVLIDRTRPSDETDLVKLGTGFGGPPRCE